MKSCFLILITSLILYSKCGAQNQIEGYVKDDQNMAMAMVNVLLFNQVDSVLVKGTISDQNGKFTLKNIEKGTYNVSLSLIGYEEINKNIKLSSDIDMGIITLMSKSENLDEVVVTARRPFLEQKLDRLIVNIKNSISSAGGTAIEILEKLPGVEVDRSRNLISLNGKEGIMIMINGKVSRQPLEAIISMLNSVSADNIEKIELIHNPPAKYEAAGNAGLINIVMIENSEQGTNGSITAYLGYGREDKEGININLNSRKNKVNLFGNFDLSRDHSYEVFTNNRVILDQDDSIASKNVSDRHPITTNFQGRLGIDYYIDKETTLGAFISGFSNRWDMEALNSGFERNNSNSSLFEINSKEKNHWKHVMGNLNFHRQLNEKAYIDFDIDYLHYNQENPTYYLNIYKDEEGNIITNEEVRGKKDTPVNIWVGSVNIKKEVSDKIEWEIGGLGIFSKLNNNVQIENRQGNEFIENPELSEKSELLESISGGYASFDYKLNKKTKLKAGLRFEYSDVRLRTQTNSDLIDINYSDLFPTFFISRKITDNSTLIFSYGRRINRPNFNDLAPFVIFLDPNTFYYGNTALQPSRASNVKIDFNYKKYLLSIGFNHETDAIARYQPIIIDSTNQQVFTSINLDYRDAFTVSLALPYKIGTWFNSTVNIMGVSRKLKTKDEKTISGNYIRINGSQYFTLSPKITFELSGFFQTEKIGGISTVGNYGSLNFGAEYKFNENNRLRFTINNLFNFKYDVFTEEDLNLNYITNTNYRFESRIFKLTYTYSFGNNKLKSERKRSTGSEEIKNRVQ